MGDWLNANSTFIGKAKTPGMVFDLGCYPALRAWSYDEPTSLVKGEVYLVEDQDVIDRMDQYEGVHTDDDGRHVGLYQPIYQQVLMEDGTNIKDVLMYEYLGEPEKTMQPIEDGEWT